MKFDVMQMLARLHGRLPSKLNANFSARQQVWRLAGFTTFALVATFCLGALLTSRLRALGEEAARSDFLMFSTLAAAGFDGDDVATLKQCYKSGKPHDACVVIQKLRRIKEEHAAFRFVYLMELVDGKVAFLADAEDINSSAFSPPGQTYAEATPELINAFNPGRGVVEGPVRDQWGEWVSSLAPIVDRYSGKVVAVLGFDIDAANWKAQVARYGRLGIIVTLALVLLLTVLALYSYRLIRLNEDRVREIGRRERSEQGLLATKAKLTGMAQELEAACQQIEADRVDLRFANQQLRESEEELRKSEEKHRKLTENVTDIIAVIDDQGQISYASPSLERVMGYALFPPGKSIFDYIHPEDRALLDEVFQNLLRKPGTIMGSEFRYRHNDGSWRVLEARAKNLVEDPKFCGVIITARDITERKQAEKDIRAAQQMLQNVLETIPVSVFWKDQGLRYLGCNTRFALQAGVETPCNLIGKTDAQLPWAAWSPCQDEDRAVLQTQKQHVNEEAVWQTPRGEISIRRSIVPLKDPEGCVMGVLGTYEDISKERRLENQLRQAQRLEALGTLAGGIASDFNNIMGAVMGYAELSMDELPAQTRARGFINEILVSTQRASDLVQHILEFSRRAKQERRTINLRNLVKDVVQALSETMPDNIRIKQELESGCALVLADSDQVYQAAMNLCTNAVHAMEEGGGDLTIALRPVVLEAQENETPLKPGHYVCLEVKDTGQGMDAAVMERMFEPYFTTKPERMSSGLGLATVYGIVKSHEGTIEVSSEVGEGTSFRVLLPCAIDKSETNVINSNKVGKATGSHILLVDDDDLMLGAMTLLLERMEYRVTPINSPGLALERFRHTPADFDLLLTDNSMPGMTGLSLAEAVLALRPDMPVILSTGLDEQVTQDKASAIGIRATLDKPIKRERLSSVIRTALS